MWHNNLLNLAHINNELIIQLTINDIINNCLVLIIIHYNIFEASRGPGKRKIKLQEENILRLMQEENNESDEEDRDFEVDQVESDGKYLRIFTALLNSLS